MKIYIFYAFFQESLIFLVNIGVVRHGIQNNSSLLDKAKFILKHVIQKKVYFIVIINC